MKRKAEAEAVREDEEVTSGEANAGVKRKAEEEGDGERGDKYKAVEQVNEDDSDMEGPPDSECPPSEDEERREEGKQDEDVVMMLMAMGIAKENVKNKEKMKK